MTDLRQAAKAVVDRWDTPAWEWRDQGPTADLMADLRKALAQPEQEPVQERITHITWDERGVRTVNGIPDDAPQRPWVGLEAEDLAQIDTDEFWQTGNHMAIAMAVEAKLKERNT
jgi:hypothetical protein